MRFLGAVWKLLVGVKDALVLIFMLMFFGLLYAGLSARPDAIEDGVLAMDLDGVLVEQAERPDPFASVPEFSRRARGFTVWAALRSLGRSGVVDMVEGFCARAAEFADGLRAIDGVEVLNDVVYTQVCVSFGPDEVTREVARRLLADGTAWMTPSTWRGRAVLRISVSNWRTSADDVERTLEAVRRVLGEVRG